MNWWNELSGLQQLFASIAIPATLVMVTQFILLLFGFSHSGGADGADAHVDMNLHDGASHDIFDGHSHDVIDIHSHDAIDVHAHGIPDAHMHDGSADHHGETHDKGDALRLFTLRSIIAFFSVGGWTGVAALGWKVPVPAAFVLAFSAGLLALYFVAWSIRAALRLQQSGNVINENAIGKTGEVYIPIPASRGGSGKVSIIVQERLCEFDAITSSERLLKTGEKITVTGVDPKGALVVIPNENAREGMIINNHLGGQ